MQGREENNKELPGFGIEQTLCVGKPHNVIHADTEKLCQFHKGGNTGEMLAMLIGADGFLCDLQFYRELELRKVFFWRSSRILFWGIKNLLPG